jgi:hypothetical protein
MPGFGARLRGEMWISDPFDDPKPDEIARFLSALKQNAA